MEHVRAYILSGFSHQLLYRLILVLIRAELPAHLYMPVSSPENTNTQEGRKLAFYLVHGIGNSLSES